MRNPAALKKILFSFLVGSALLLVPLQTYAQFGSGSGGPDGGLNDLNKNGQIPTAGINVNSKEGVVEVIAKVIEWALYLSGAIAVVFVILGGYRYLTAGGNEETATKGRKTVVNALIGLVIIILAYVIVNAVTNFIIN